MPTHDEDLFAPPSDEELFRAPTAEEQEGDLFAAPEPSALVPTPVNVADEESQQNEFWAKIAQDLEPVTPSTLIGEVASIPGQVASLPGLIAKQAPKELETILQKPGEAAEFAAKKLAQSASIAGPQHGLSAAYEKYFVAPIWDKIRGQQGLKEALTTWVPERYADRSVEDIAAQNIAHQKAQEEELPLTGLATSVAGPAALQMAGIPFPVTLGGQKFGEVLEQTGRPVEALAEGTKAALLTELLNRGVGALIKGVKKAPGTIKEAISEKAAMNAAQSFGGTPSTIAKIGKERLAAAGEEAAALLEGGLPSKKTLQTRLSEKLDDLGQKIEQNVENISTELAERQPSLVSGALDDIVLATERKVLQPLAENLGQESFSPATFTVRQKLKELKRLGSPLEINEKVLPTSPMAPEFLATIKESYKKYGLDFDAFPRKFREDVISRVSRELPTSVTKSAPVEPIIPKPTFKQLNEFKKALGNEISSWEKMPHERIPDMATQRGLQTLYGEVKKALEDMAGLTSNEQGLQYKQLKRSISNLKTIQKPAFEGAKAQEAYELKSDIPGTAEHSLRTLRYGLGKVLLPLQWMHDLSQRYGNPMGAHGYRALEGLIEGAETGVRKGATKVGQTATTAARAASAAAFQKAPKIMTALQKMPNYFGPFTFALKKAASQGATSLGATSYMLHQQYPEYRDLLDKLEAEEIE